MSLRQKTVSSKILSSLRNPNSQDTPDTGESLKSSDPGQTLVPVRDFNVASTKGWISAGGVQVIYSKTIKRMTLQRALCSKIVFQPEKCTFADILILFDNMIILQDQCFHDQGFSSKFSKNLELLAEILRRSRITKAPTLVELKQLSKKIKELDNFYIPERNLSNALKLIQGKTQIRMGKPLGTPTDSIEPARFIGIGYRDKGTARDLAFNGEPSWQEYCKMRLWDNK